MGSAVIGALRVNLSIDSAEFKRGLNAAEEMLARFDRALTSVLKAGLTAFAAGVTTGGAALAALTKSSMDTISAQVDLARRVGASVAAIQSLEYQTDLAGGSSEALAKTIATLNQKLGEVEREGAGPAYEALQRLGLSARQLSEMDADERIKTLADRMAELHYSTQQQADVLRDLGVKQKEMINLFQEGSGAIDAAKGELKAWGVLLSDVDAAKVEAAGDAWDKIGVILQGVGNQLAVRLSPLIQAAAEYLGDAAKNTGGFGDAMDTAINWGIRLFVGLNTEIYDFLKSIYMAGDAFIELFNSAAKAPPDLIAKIFGGTAEDYGFKPIENSFKQLLANLGEAPSLEKWEAYWANMQQKANDAAKAAVAAARPGSVSEDDNGGETEAEAKERERLGERLQQKLDTLREALMTEREQEQANYEERLADLQNFYDRGMVSTQENADLRQRIERDHADAVKAIDDEIAKNAQRNAEKERRAYYGIASDISSVLDSIFGESKLAAIAHAVINTAQAVTRNLAEYPGPLGIAAAAAAAAAGLAEIATIRSTSKSGGGSGGGGRSAGAAASAPSAASSGAASAPALGQTLYVSGINPGQIFTGEAMRGLMEQLVEAQRDGAKLVLAPA